MLNKNGRLILVGVPRKESDIKIHSLHFGRQITVSRGESVPDKDIPRLLNVMNKDYDAKSLLPLDIL